MKTICIIGASSTIAESFIDICHDKIITVGRTDADITLDLCYNNIVSSVDLIPQDCDMYLITIGLLYPKTISEQTNDEILSSSAINLMFPTLLIDKILATNDKARIVVIGSESGFKGSYDTSYFVTKAGLSSYVREKHINYPDQQLNMIAPSVILDSKMTQSRNDLQRVIDNAKTLPKERYLSSKEVAEAVYFLLYDDNGYINNEVLNMNGGKFARMKIGK